MDGFSLLLKICGISLLACVCLGLIGRISAGVATVLRAAAAVTVFGVLLYFASESVRELWGMVSRLLGSTFATESVTIMLKALGMALVAKLCADVCRDSGEGAVAGGIESAGRLAILALAIPLFVEILELAAEMLGLSEI